MAGFEPIGNVFYWRSIADWLRSYQAAPRLRPASCGVVVGAPGVGKTTGVRALCEELGMEVVVIGAENCGTAKELRDHLHKGCRCRLEASIQGTRAPRVLLLDALEVLVQMDRLVPSTLWAVLQEGNLPDVPILCTLATPTDRKMGEMRQKCQWWHLSAPSEGDVLAWLRREYRGRLSTRVLCEVAEAAEGNLAAAKRRAEDAVRAPGAPTTATVAPPRDVADLYRTCDPRAAMHLLMEDPWMHPLRFHENLAADFRHRTAPEDRRCVGYMRLLEQICAWDVWFQRYESYDAQMEVFARTICDVFRDLPRGEGAPPAVMEDFTKVFSVLSLRKKNARAHAAHALPVIHLPSLAWAAKKG